MDILQALEGCCIKSGVDAVLDQSTPDDSDVELRDWYKLLVEVETKAQSTGGHMAVTITIPPLFKYKGRFFDKLIVDKQYKIFTMIIDDVFKKFSLKVAKSIRYASFFELHKSAKIHSHISFMCEGLYLHPYYTRLLKDLFASVGFNKRGLDIDYCRHPTEWRRYIIKDIKHNPMKPVLRLR